MTAKEYEKYLYGSIESVMIEHPSEVAKIQSNKAFGYLVGQCMRIEPRCNPAVVKKLLVREILYGECLKWISSYK